MIKIVANYPGDGMSHGKNVAVEVGMLQDKGYVVLSTVRLASSFLWWGEDMTEIIYHKGDQL